MEMELRCMGLITRLQTYVRFTNLAYKNLKMTDSQSDTTFTAILDFNSIYCMTHFLWVEESFQCFCCSTTKFEWKHPKNHITNWIILQCFFEGKCPFQRFYLVPPPGTELFPFPIQGWLDEKRCLTIIRAARILCAVPPIIR